MSELQNTTQEQNAQLAAAENDQANFSARSDWRVKLTLAPEANYLYLADNEPESILAPLRETNGVIFPYLPTFQINYKANYDKTNPTHTNYGFYQYTNSEIDSITVTANFSAQDTAEAKYMLAVIHFFRTVTKMFYGQDQDPKRGTPPPLVYIYGLGEFQFNAHPLAVSNFSYILPNDVDYVKTTNPKPSGTQSESSSTVSSNPRLDSLDVQPGGLPPRAKFPGTSVIEGTTYVPTKLQMTINFVPILSRNAISNRFSFKEYATGKLLQGSKNPGGGIW